MNRKVLTLSLTLSLVAIPLAPQAVAQQVGGNIAYSFGIEELEKHPGIVNLSPGFMTVLQFDEAIQEVKAGNPDLVAAEGSKLDPSSIVLRPKLVSGRTDLRITLETGRVANFVLNIRRGVSGTSVTIKNPASATLPAMPTQSLVNSSNATSTGDDINLVTQLQLDNTGRLIVNYSLTNPYPYSLEIASVRLLEAAGALPLRLESFESSLEANSSQTGRAVLLRNPTGKLSLEIGMKNAAGVSTYLKRELDVGAMLKAAGK